MRFGGYVVAAFFDKILCHQHSLEAVTSKGQEGKKPWSSLTRGLLWPLFPEWSVGDFSDRQMYSLSQDAQLDLGAFNLNGTRRCRIEFGSAHEVPGEVVFAAQGFSAGANLGDFANLCEHHPESGNRCLDGGKIRPFPSSKRLLWMLLALCPGDAGADLYRQAEGSRGLFWSLSPEWPLGGFLHRQMYSHNQDAQLDPEPINLNGTRWCRIESGSAHKVPRKDDFAPQEHSAGAEMGNFANPDEYHLWNDSRCLDGEKIGTVRDWMGCFGSSLHFVLETLVQTCTDRWKDL